MTVSPQLMQLAVEEMPNVIAGLKALFGSRHPTLPVPTSEEVIAAYNSSYQASLAKDDAFEKKPI
jgi:hypothetical protein